MSPFLPTPLENVQGGELLCSASTKDETQVDVSQRRGFKKNMTVSDKTADYCSKTIFLDEASLLENNNQDNGRLLCCVTPLKWFKKAKKKKSCTRCDSASSRLRPTALPVGCRLGTEGRRTQGCIVPPWQFNDPSVRWFNTQHAVLHLKTIMRTLPPLGCKVFPYRSTNSTVKTEHQGSSY